MPSKLPPITVRLERINHRKFAYIAYVSGRTVSGEGRLIVTSHIREFEEANGAITNEQLEKFEEQMKNND